MVYLGIDCLLFQHLQLDGGVSCEGTSGYLGGENIAGGGGSGGSVLIRANTMTGRGHVTANGGKAGRCEWCFSISYLWADPKMHV